MPTLNVDRVQCLTLTIEQVGQVYGVGPQTVSKWAAKGLIPRPIRISRQLLWKSKNHNFWLCMARTESTNTTEFGVIGCHCVSIPCQGQGHSSPIPTRGRESFGVTPGPTGSARQGQAGWVLLTQLTRRNPLRSLGLRPRTVEMGEECTGRHPGMTPGKSISLAVSSLPAPRVQSQITFRKL